MLVPPANFGIAEEGIYRCSKVETLNLSFLETLNLKTVLFVGGQEPSKFFREFFANLSIEWSLIRIADFSVAGEPATNNANKGSTSNRDDVMSDGLPKTENHGTESTFGGTYHLTDQDDLMLIKSSCIKKTLYQLLNTEKHNLLLVDRTSIIIGILRKIQKWSLSSVINEYRLFSGKNRSYFAETFLEVLNINVEQEKEDQSLVEPMSDLHLTPDPLLESTTMDRLASNTEIVSEADLSSSPTVPTRLLRMIEEAENHRRTQSRTDEFESPHMTKSSSSLGIFGSRYRLAFNRNDFKYYRSQNCNDTQDVLTVKIPRESALPHWLKFQRDLWEKENAPQQHNFYTEHIFT
ncbi:hypothetical protein HG537_0F00240 [Torulaspora globosa]|uniref:Uncharacterized protein n=1 Tax=Torulaspora globosa TaxID=48254 RepID=A0A7H9HVG2_9SACH|nr:hypothetical protein HG537_0F00240 [Torulaspora sp. CBS 2947]